jgi:IS4 transposase
MVGLINVRIVNIQLDTGETEILATNLFDAEMTLEDLNKLYNLRWGIETNYHYLKESMKIENISSSKKLLIEQDIFSQMLSFNLLQAI